MGRLFLFLLVVAAAWYGWKHYPDLLSRRPGHDLVIENAGSADIERVRVTVDGQTLVKEVVPSGQKAVMQFKVTRDSDFDLIWETHGRMGERHWTGGSVPKGPMLQRHIFRIQDDGEVMYTTENKLAGI